MSTVSKYKYTNKFKTVLKPKEQESVVKEHEKTGVSQSKIIADAVKFYFTHRDGIPKTSKNTY